MKVSIPVKRTVTETVELPQLPYYSCQYGTIYYMITAEENVIKVAPKQITHWGPNETYYGEYLVQAYQAEPCTNEVFDKAVSIVLDGINTVLTPAKGAVTNTMKDPNLQPASTPTTEQVAAVEQEAQEQAMESAEEGEAEG